jgi:excisionase family DNA binding protein
MNVRLTIDDFEPVRLIFEEVLAKFMAKKEEELLTREELCKKLGISKSTYHAHVREGKIRVKKTGRKLILLDS